MHRLGTTALRLVLAALLLAAVSRSASAPAEDSREYDIKAAFTTSSGM